MKKGIVKWFNAQKGYGFISGENEEVFVHYSGITGKGYKSLEEGQHVTYDTEEVDDKVKAVNVTVVE